jgi:NAD(P)-dependent dehydrogenase (short-subunit alcohol dehydrogenase family)
MATFTGKVALITGGTSGIGRATAVAFAREGARVVVAGRRPEEGAETVRLIKQAGGDGLFVRADVSRDADVRAVVEQTLKQFGRLDVALNNAGIEQTPEPLTQTTEDSYDKIIDINVKGVWLSLKYEIPAMLRTGGGAIVNTSSVGGLIGMANVPVYIASKHAVIGLTKAVALEYAKQGIRVNAVAPGGVETAMFDRFLTVVPREAMMNMHPIGRAGQPEEIAAGVVWLCSPAASFVTGQTLALDGGFTAQ